MRAVVTRWCAVRNHNRAELKISVQCWSRGRGRVDNRSIIARRARNVEHVNTDWALAAAGRAIGGGGVGVGGGGVFIGMAKNGGRRR